MSDAREPVVFDRAASCYDATRGFPPGVEDRVAALLVRAGGLGPRSRVLEIGIGTGRIALPLAGHVRAVAGVDLSAPMLRRLAAKRDARSVHPVRADAARLPFPDAAFDAAVAVHVFHLVPGWRAVLAELARVLGPGGLLLHGGNVDPGLPDRPEDRTESDALVPPPAGVPRARIEGFPGDAGWAAHGDPGRIAFPVRLRPRDVLARLERRAWSATWDLDDAALARLVAARRRELETCYGDLDRDLELEAGFWARAWRPPA